MPADDGLTGEQQELLRLRERVRELETSQRQLEIYAEDLRRTFGELRRQLTHMSDLHRISTSIGEVLEPAEVMARTLEGVGRLVENQAACIYLVEGEEMVRAATVGDLALLPPERLTVQVSPFGSLLSGADAAAIPADARSLMVVMRASGKIIGVLYIVRAFGAPLVEDDRKLAEMVATEAAAAIYNARLYEQTQRLAITDPLTGLSNHRNFREALGLEVARASRLGYAVGLLMVDVDNFKRVNDTFGHPVGDEVLKSIAGALRTNLRQTDLASRYGGEEFAIILPGLGLRGVRAVGEKLRRAVRSLHPLTIHGAPPMYLSISIGGVSASQPDLDGAEMIRTADLALYAAKHRGRNTVCLYPDDLADDQPPPEMHRHEQAHSPAR
ncbi:MAG: sensor domain-containing diguanylate cyclase [Chloroflexi bacterium]|nr:sensor domain-containing diguanylate cyclase [Chloroflexota bacterium]